MKATLIRIAAVMCLISANANMGATAAMPASGEYDAKIIKSELCKLDSGDRRMCRQLRVKLSNGQVMDGKVWGGAVEILDTKGRSVFSAKASNDPWQFDEAVKSYLKAGTNARTKVSCGRDCDIVMIQIR